MSEAHKALHMAVMKPRELRLVAHPSSFYVFIYLYIYIFYIPPPEGSSDMKRDQTAHKSYINSTGLQNDKQSSLLCCKFTACISLCKGTG